MVTRKIDIKIKILATDLPLTITPEAGGNSKIVIPKNGDIFFYESGSLNRITLGATDNALEQFGTPATAHAKAAISHVEMTLPTKLVDRINGLITLKNSRKGDITNAEPQEDPNK